MKSKNKLNIETENLHASQDDNLSIDEDKFEEWLHRKLERKFKKKIIIDKRISESAKQI